jgi:hypothetical protein
MIRHGVEYYRPGMKVKLFIFVLVCALAIAQGRTLTACVGVVTCAPETVSGQTADSLAPVITAAPASTGKLESLGGKIDTFTGDASDGLSQEISTPFSPPPQVIHERSGTTPAENGQGTTAPATTSSTQEGSGTQRRKLQAGCCTTTPPPEVCNSGIICHSQSYPSQEFDCPSNENNNWVAGACPP